MKPSVTTAVVAGIAILATAAAYIIKGTVPDVLTILSTTSVGGFLGISVPQPVAAPPAQQ